MLVPAEAVVILFSSFLVAFFVLAISSLPERTVRKMLPTRKSTENKKLQTDGSKPASNEKNFIY